MSSSVTLDAVVGTVWIAVLLVASLTVLGTPLRALSARIGPKAILLIALAVRLVPALMLNAGARADITSYWIIGHLTLAGQDVYTAPAATGHYPYLPAQLWLSALAVHLATALHGLPPFVVLMKIPSVLADAATALLLVLGLQARGAAPATARRIGLLYALNPISTLVTAYHGQFDAVPLFLCVLAWTLLPRGATARGVAVAAPAGLALGAAILVKSWPILLVPAVLLAVRRDRGLLAGVLLGACLVPLVATLGYTLAYHVPLDRLAATTLGYSSTPGWWGLGALSAWLHGHRHLLSVADIALVARLSEVLVIVAAVALPLWLRQHSLEDSMLAVLLVFYVVSANFAVQYLMWILPFGLLALAQPARPRLAYAAFVACGTAALLATYMLAGWIYHTLPGPTLLVMKGWQVGFYGVYAISLCWCVQHLAGMQPRRAWQGIRVLGVEGLAVE